MPPTPKPTTLPKQHPQHVADPTPGAPARAVPSNIMGEVQEAMAKVYLTGTGEVRLMQDRGTVSYDEDEDVVTIKLNMMTHPVEDTDD